MRFNGTTTSLFFLFSRQSKKWPALSLGICNGNIIMVSTDMLFRFPEITLQDDNKHKMILVQCNVLHSILYFCFKEAVCSNHNRNQWGLPLLNYWLKAQLVSSLKQIYFAVVRWLSGLWFCKNSRFLIFKQIEWEVTKNSSIGLSFHFNKCFFKRRGRWLQSQLGFLF